MDSRSSREAEDRSGVRGAVAVYQRCACSFVVGLWLWQTVSLGKVEEASRWTGVVGKLWIYRALYGGKRKQVSPTGK
jgi:hypothetical protein